MIALDGAWREDGGELAWEGLGHLRTRVSWLLLSREVAEGSAWVKIMDEDPKLARLLSIKFLRMRRST